MINTDTFISKEIFKHFHSKVKFTFLKIHWPPVQLLRLATSTSPRKILEVSCDLLFVNYRFNSYLRILKKRILIKVREQYYDVCISNIF